MEMPKKKKKPSLDPSKITNDAPPPPPSVSEMGVLEQGFFAGADTDGDDYISKAEFISYHYRRNRQPPNDADWKAFYAADINHDGRVSREEFEEYCAVRWRSTPAAAVAGGRRARRKETPLLDVEATQTSTDAGGGGDGEEGAPSPLPEPAAELGALEDGFFEEADADHDGFVSKSEYIGYHYTRSGRAPSAADWKTFYAADANHDGRISREEFDAYIAAVWGEGAGPLTDGDAEGAEGTPLGRDEDEREREGEAGGRVEEGARYPPGSRVRVAGLVSAAEHNGACARA